MMLKLRRFTLGRDEEDWLRVWNMVYGTCLDLAPITVDEMTAIEKSPDFDTEGMFIAELDNQPVGIVHAYVDKFREDKKGFLKNFGVVPELQGRGIERRLAEKALTELKNRGMQTVQCSAYGDQTNVVRLWKKLSFKLVRTLSLMTRDLVGLQSEIGGNVEIVLKPLRRGSDTDLVILNRLENECSIELFDWRPSSLERTIYLIREDPLLKVQLWFFAVLNGKCVGYVGMGVDESYNMRKDAKCGWVLGIGVLKPYRGMGVGTKLILHGMNQLKTMGMNIAMLGVDDLNVTKATSLYEKLGFRIARKELVFEKSLD